MASGSRNLACSLDEATLRSLAAPDRSSTLSIARTDRAALASRHGMDPKLCFEHRTDELTAVGCFDTEGSTAAIPYQIIDLSLTRP
jgi:hypothetical protein